MNWSRFLIVFLGNVLLGVALSTLALGGLGFALAGAEGLVNGATWGVAFGLFGSTVSGFLWAGKYWSDYAGRFGSAWLREETEGKPSPTTPNGRDSAW